VPGDLLENGGIGWGDVHLAQLHLRRGPREVECALRRMRIVITAGQLERALPAFGDQRRERHRS
jgi:hypothetical protein